MNEKKDSSTELVVLGLFLILLGYLIWGMADFTKIPDLAERGITMLLWLPGVLTIFYAVLSKKNI